MPVRGNEHYLCIHDYSITHNFSLFLTFSLALPLRACGYMAVAVAGNTNI